MQCLIKKDKEDQKDPAIQEFYNKLATAYEDPSLKPVHFSGETDSHTSPLLQTAEELSWYIHARIFYQISSRAVRDHSFLLLWKSLYGLLWFWWDLNMHAECCAL